MTENSHPPTARSVVAPEPIKAIPLRHPGRLISAALIAALLLAFIINAATKDTYEWDVYGKYLFDTRILEGVVVTIELTVVAMVGGVLGGVLLSVMRLSENPVLRIVAWGYLWIFRGTPVYVQLVFWGLLITIYPSLDIGIPLFWFAAVGLLCNEAAYMAEIVRAGIGSVSEGQTEASTALGMTWAQTMRRTVLPQAMRVIVPPTGNEFISMLKTATLVTAIPLSTELFGQQREIAGATFKPVPLLLVAATWYLVITSVFMFAQSRIEKRYARGTTRAVLLASHTEIG